MIRYAARYYEEDGFQMVEVPAFDAVTQGTSPEHVRVAASDLVSGLSISEVWTHGRKAPAGERALPKGAGWEWVYPDPKVVMAIEIRGLREGAGLSMAEAAERIGVSSRTYQRWEHPEKCNARVDTLQKIAQRLPTYERPRGPEYA